MVSLHIAVAVLALSSAGQSVLLDFYTDYCGPCREMNPTVQALVKAGYPVQRVNASQNRALAAKYGITQVPCFVMVVNGKEVGRILGKTSYASLEQLCKRGAVPARSSPPLLALGAPALNAPASNAAASNAAASAAPVALQPASPFPQQTPNTLAANAVASPALAAAALTAPTDAELLAVSVRLRVKDPDGNSCGSGTIIDCREEEALVLTCGHLFRDSKGKSDCITVEMFQAGKAQAVSGRLISYDLDRDVALVAIKTSGRVPTARIAPPNYKVQPSDAVASVGCNHGADPTVRHTEVVSLNRFNGHPNLQVSDQPVEGRSGGGLFTKEGYVIGVCIFADPSTQQGTYAAPAAIYSELDENKLAAVYNANHERPIQLPGVAANAAPAAIAAIATPPAALPGPVGANPIVPTPPLPSTLPGPAPGGDAMASWTPATATATAIPTTMTANSSNTASPIPSAAAAAGIATASATTPLAPHEQAAFDEIRRREKEGAEVVCIVRPRNDPNAKSDVIILDHASPELVRRLAAENRRADQPYETSLEMPKPRHVLLEWSK